MLPKIWSAGRSRAQQPGPMRVLGLALVLSLGMVGQAHARREQTYSYSFTRVWNTAVRLLRIDFGSPITEKDKESGYFLFDYNDGPNKQHPGSVEVIRLQEGNADSSVRVVVQIPELPGYVEQNLLDKLGRKLSAEYGAPIGAKPAPAAKGEGAKPDAPATEGQPPPAKSSGPAQAKPQAKP